MPQEDPPPLRGRGLPREAGGLRQAVTVTFRGRSNVADWSVGDAVRDKEFSSSGAETVATHLWFGQHSKGTTGTMLELRWPSGRKAVILNTNEFEYINMPGTQMKVLARGDDVEFPDGHKAKRYYVLEVQADR